MKSTARKSNEPNKFSLTWQNVTVKGPKSKRGFFSKLLQKEQQVNSNDEQKLIIQNGKQSFLSVYFIYKLRDYISYRSLSIGSGEVRPSVGHNGRERSGKDDSPKQPELAQHEQARIQRRDNDKRSSRD